MANGSSRVVAIQATDVVDYGRLIDSDPIGTLARIQTHRRALIDPLIAKCGGRVVGTLGDNWIVEFKQAADAVRCSIGLQTGMAKRNVDVPPDKRVAFRVGVNVGELTVEGDKINGAGVAHATGMLATATAGDIRISEAAFAEARTDPALGLDRFATAGSTEADGSLRIPIRQPASVEARPKPDPTPQPGQPKKPAATPKAIPTRRQRPAWAVQEKPKRPPPRVRPVEAAEDETAEIPTLTGPPEEPISIGRWALGLGVIGIVIAAAVAYIADYGDSADILANALEATQRQTALIGSNSAEIVRSEPPVVEQLGGSAVDFADRSVETGSFGEAEARLLEEYDRRSAELGGDHLSMADVLSGLAHLYKAQGRHDEAAPLVERALGIHERDLARSLEIYASILEDTGRADEAWVIKRRIRALEARAAEAGP